MAWAFLVLLSFQVVRLDTVFKVDAQLRQDLAPIPVPPSPFFCEVHCRQIEKFEQSIIGREDRSRFGGFPELPVEILDLVGRVNHPA